eukprot:TRINITY_DN6777_c0_g2_i1.p1 TRINITY_DN6777_c0_g2~~TRINITY_DN6777_c0_g2_i1.p1  ORF type:complete len:483 (+),score=127.29 TRINITY_DN6777_c0_g2_i1:107-1450(+)
MEVIPDTNRAGGRVISDDFYSPQALEVKQLKEALRESQSEIGRLEEVIHKRNVDPTINSFREDAARNAAGELVSKKAFTPIPLRDLPSEKLTYTLDNIKDRTVNNTIVLSFCSIKYIEPMVNWVGLLVKHGITNYGIVCLDLELRSWLRERGSECNFILSGWKHGVWDPEETNTECVNGNAVPPLAGPMALAKCKQSCEYDIECSAVGFYANGTCAKCTEGYTTRTEQKVEVHVKRTTTTLWYARWKLLVRLLDAGVHVMLADLDAIFLRNPIPFLNNLPEGDLIAQRGSFPNWLSEKWGAALCMGFVFWRSTDATKRFTVHMHKVISKTGDDQIGVNVALDILNVKWDETRVTYADSTEVSYGSTPQGLRVALLPHTGFPRRCDEIPIDAFKKDVMVAHCYESKKSGEAKKAKAKAYGLWVIKDDWMSSPVLPNFEAYIRSILAEY